MGDNINVSNVSKQRIDISIPPKKIDPTGEGCTPTIEIMHIFMAIAMKEFEISLDTKIPKALSILPQVKEENISTVDTRENAKIYVQVGDTPSYATLEQLKELNTKTVFVDELSDTKIHKLSNEDIVMLRKE